MALVYITKLSLTNFRNYVRLELDLPPHMVVFHGDNAQGKSNLLDAIYLLATTRSHRATIERELINWSALGDSSPVARLWAEVRKAAGSLQLEIALRGRMPDNYVEKRIRINGAVRRATELVGQINVVLFSSQDIDLVGGRPALRRRYLDITNSQIDPRYLQALQRYNRVLVQRNHLLRLIGERRTSPQELAFWDRELAEAGAYLTAQRRRMIAALNGLAQATHRQLSGEEELRIVYRQSGGEKIPENLAESQIETIRGAFQQALDAARDKEIAQGVSLVGPHRDDLRFLVNERDMGIYGSRGQQRTVALSLKLAEAGFMLGQTQDPPLLLLDDVFSELDVKRRRHLSELVAGYHQVLITTTDPDHLEPGFLARAAQFRVGQGEVKRLEASK